MSATHLPPDPQPAPGGADPSMEDILASIRRILNEDERNPAAAPNPAAEPEGAAAEPARSEPESDVFMLDTSMLVAEPPAPVPPAEPPAASGPQAALEAAPADVPAPPRSSALDELEPLMSNVADEPTADHAVAEEPPARPVPALVAPAAAQAAATSVAELLRAVVAERQQAAVYRGGPTIEDVVRDEVRPLLKAWLDANLPPLVERLVRTEIERVVGRVAS
jgi:cell pole-organizing protein PopZ